VGKRRDIFVFGLEQSVVRIKSAPAAKQTVGRQKNMVNEN
jgi:hypothetical protein